MTAGEPFTKIVVVEDDAPDTGDLFDVGDVLKRSIRSIIEDEFEVPIRKEQLVAKSVAQFLDYIGLDTTPRHGGPGSNSTFDSLLKRYGEGPMNIVDIAKSAIAGDTAGLAGVVSSAEYLGELNKRAAAIRKPGESQAQAFARYTRDEHHGGMYPDGAILLKAATRHAQDVNPELRKAYRPDPVTSPAASRDDLMREHIFPRV